MKRIGILVWSVFAAVGCCGRDESALIQEAIKKSDLIAVERYISNGGDPNLYIELDGNPRERMTILAAAVLVSKPSIVKYLVNSAGSDPNLPDYSARTPVMAVFGGRNPSSERSEIVGILAEVSSLDWTDNYGYNTFHEAAAYGTIEEISVLVKYNGSLVNRPNENGDLPWQVAKDRKVREYLLQFKEQR